MPEGDRTGPTGQGPGTGRAFGYCYGYDSPGCAKGPGRGMGKGFAYGRGMGRGREFGRGRKFAASCHGYIHGPQNRPPLNKEDEVRFLKSEAEALKHSQQDIEKRLLDLEKED